MATVRWQTVKRRILMYSSWRTLACVLLVISGPFWRHPPDLGRMVDSEKGNWTTAGKGPRKASRRAREFARGTRYRGGPVRSGRWARCASAAGKLVLAYALERCSDVQQTVARSKRNRDSSGPATGGRTIYIRGK